MAIVQRFENFDNFPDSSIKALLLDEALRQKISVESNPDIQMELIRDALLRQTQEATESNEKLQAISKELELKALDKEASAKKLADELEEKNRAIAELEGQITALKTQEVETPAGKDAHSNGELTSLHEQIRRLEKGFADRSEKEKLDNEIRKYHVDIFILLLRNLSVGAFVAWGLAVLSGMGGMPVYVAMGLVAVELWILEARRAGEASDNLEASAPGYFLVNRLARFSVWIGLIVAALVVKVLFEQKFRVWFDSFMAKH